MIGPAHVGSLIAGAALFLAINYFFYNFPSRVPAPKGSN